MAPRKDVNKCSKPQYKNEADCKANGGSWDQYASAITDYVTNPEIFQQTFLGLSIMDFSANLGLGSNSSSLSVNLVRDEVNFETYLTPSGTRDAVSEGYHPNDPNAFPIDLLRLHNLENEDNPSDPDKGMGKLYSTHGDIPFIPDPGSPVFFDYYSGRDLIQDCVKRDYDDDGILKDGALTCNTVFSFPGILTKYDKKFSTSGETYTVEIADPRSILENTIVVLNKFAARTSPADAYRIEDSEREYEKGWNGYYNIINVFGYYEYHGFNKSDITEAGMIWNNPNKQFINKFGFYNPLLDEDQQAPKRKHAFGILGALANMLSGKDTNYIEEFEPFGGPLHYSKDTRNVNPSQSILNSASIKDESGAVKLDEDGNPESWHIHRYLVDLTDFFKFSSQSSDIASSSSSSSSGDEEGLIPNDWRISGDTASLLSLIEQACAVVGADFYVTLSPITKNLIKDGFIEPEEWPDVKNYSGIIKVVPIPRTTTINRGSIGDAVDLSQKTPPEGPFVDNENNPTLVSANLGYEFTDPIEGKMVLGAPRTRVIGVTPLGDVNVRKDTFYNQTTGKYFDKTNTESYCVDGNGDKAPSYTNKADCEAQANHVWTTEDVTDEDPAPTEEVDSILTEFLPHVEDDGVTLINQDFPKDEFPPDDIVMRWNPYGKQGIYSDKETLDYPDFERNLPPVSNDNYLPWYWPQDFKQDGGFNPYQLNRLNSKHQLNAGDCDVKACLKIKPPLKDPEVVSGPTNASECADQGGDWEHPDTEDLCSDASGTWTKNYSTNSGYLDLYPCWGFETIELVKGGAVAQGSCSEGSLKTQEECEKEENGKCLKTADDSVVQIEKEDCLGPVYKWVVGSWSPADPQSIAADNVYNDIVDLSVRGNPIKGFFNDDDPYRDFHPTEGIFSGIEFFNPSLGICEELATGQPNEDYENLKFICECDPRPEVNTADSDCAVKKAGDTKQYKWRPWCINWGACRDKSNIDISSSMHEDIVGPENNVGENAWACQNACFTEDGNGDPQGSAIVAYYAKDFKEGAFEKKAGEAATFNDPKWEVNTESKTIKFVGSPADCTDSGNLLATPEVRSSFAVDANGDALPSGFDPADMNQFESGGSLYSPGCKAVSYRNPFDSRCEATQDIENDKGKVLFHKGDWTDAGTPRDCKAKYPGKAEWTIVSDFTYGPQFTDDFTGRVIESKDNPAPGYTQPRIRLKGVCRQVRNSDGEKQDPKDPPNNEEIESERDCYDQDNGGSQNEVHYKPVDLNTGIGLPLVCRTSTIPIDLGNTPYKGGPKSSINDPAKRYDEFYYATVTELRHAAQSIDSWKIFVKTLQPYMPCWFYEKTPEPSNAWGDLCPAKDEVIIHGGKSQTTLEAAKVLVAWGNSSPPPMASTGVIDESKADPEEAQSISGFVCGDKPRTTSLTLFQATSMEIDMVYKKIKDVADNFYGKKYLVPLPFNPPSTVHCTNPKYDNQDECEDAGFDWGVHGLLSEWFAKQGIGRCTDGVSPDKYTCEIIAREKWIEPIQEINRWEIATNGAWPGGDIEFNFGTPDSKNANTGYPQNMNFWTEEGNLKSFVIFPEKDYRRATQDSKILDFRDLDAETMHVEPVSEVGPNDNWGKKVFVAAEVDAKTHWLKERPDWEIHHEKQYFRYRCGDDAKVDGGGIDHAAAEEYLKIGHPGGAGGLMFGTETELKTRPVYIRENEIDNTGSEQTNEFAAYKPYALVTLANRAFYPDIDMAHPLMNSCGGNKNEMCLPLTKGGNSNFLLGAWLNGLLPQGVTAQQLIAMQARSKYAPNLGPDMGKGSFVAAAYKPWHAAIPQQSKHYRWGPWAAGLEAYGKTEFSTDDGLHPAAFGGETQMGDVAMSRIETVIGQSENRVIETGSIELVGIPAYAFGTQLTYFDSNGEEVKGPYITDVSLRVGSNGLTTSYSFSTQRKFGDLGKLYEDRIRKSQSDIMQRLSRAEEQMERVRRGIGQYQKDK